MKRLISLFLLLFMTLPTAVAYASVYTVSPGDSLAQISRKYQSTIGEIRAANSDLKGDLLQPGQKVIIPDRSHTVQQGENLYSIGLTYSVSFQDIMQSNDLKNSVIHPGQVLSISAVIQDTGGDSPSPAGGSSYTDGDLDLLARLITAEADSESYAAKVAVGAVVMNRVKSPLFPDTITEVINQEARGVYQFAPVRNGLINRPAKPDAIQAAKDALGGSDPTNGALFFFESWVQSPHLRSLPVSMVIDSFTFAFAH